MQTAPTKTVPGSIAAKSHYQVLDGLRGVAALIVVTFHTFEPFSKGDHTKQIINHGYLAVDFFFLLSGFVVAYAYDDRWGRMGQWEFYKRRLVRLQPMVVMGSLIGAALFYLQAGPAFPPIAHTPVAKMLVVMLIGCTLIPITPSLDIRGWQEMHPLDGPAWSLFFEYIANILYATVLRRLGKALLSVFVFASAIFLIHMAVTSPQGDVIGGWSITPTELHVGFARLLYPFFAGVLLMRLGWRIHTKHAFLLCSILLAAVLAIPRAGGPLWVNGLYDSLSIIFIFPLIVAIGAGALHADGEDAGRVCRFLGELSYPLYITHYPLIYIYTNWVAKGGVTPAQGWAWGAALLITAVSIAYACLKLYDEPVRAWLSRRVLARR
ncbi:acyltransferase family protein [Silvibacterium sp.]|uniref:acyltransferase family protein n=1 Tax=Silvibacterium sp. TaxID=1964179 RepID=UPI0039E51845